jgi:hypothetical protein
LGSIVAFAPNTKTVSKSEDLMSSTKLDSAEYQKQKAGFKRVRAVVRALVCSSAVKHDGDTAALAAAKARFRSCTTYATDFVLRGRNALLAWGFLRGLPYRRFEGRRHLQNMQEVNLSAFLAEGYVGEDGAKIFFEHNKPDVRAIAMFINAVYGDVDVEQTYTAMSPLEKAIGAWLNAEPPHWTPRERTQMDDFKNRATATAA